MNTEDIIQPTNPRKDWEKMPPPGVFSSVGTWAIPPRGPIIEYSEEYERNKFARAALIGILGCEARPFDDDAKVEWAFTLADKMMKASKVKP